MEAATGNVLNIVTVGKHHGMVTFTPDGSKLLVANEGEWLNTNGGPGNRAMQHAPLGDAAV